MPSFTAREGQDSPLPGLLAAPADLAATAWQQAIQGAAEQASNFAYIIYVSLSTRHRESRKMHRLPLHYTTVF